MSLKKDLKEFKQRLKRHADHLEAVVDADDWSPLDTAEAADDLFWKFSALLESNKI